MVIPELFLEFFPLQDESQGNTVGVSVADVFTCTRVVDWCELLPSPFPLLYRDAL